MRELDSLKPPFPYFGGKRRAADLVWPRFGDVPNYVEPFAGSLAVLLARPTPPRIETVNDIDCYIANVWRAIAADPEGVAHFADWPVNEADLHARHRWLVSRVEFRERMKNDPDYFDAKIAGWWLWGICQWIGSGWCVANRSDDIAPGGRPHLSGAGQTGMGIHQKRPILRRGGRGVTGYQIPALRGDSGASGMGIHASGLAPVQLPDLGGNGGAAGKGDHASALAKKLPRMDRGTDTRMTQSGEAILGWMLALQDRLRRVRVACGDWTRVLGRSSTECVGVTGVFLDPPYAHDTGRDTDLYSTDEADVSAKVRDWAMENGDNPNLRIALCGYEGEHVMPDTWDCVAWKANGGYAAAAGNYENAKRERIWFSPACLRPNEKLF